MEKNNFCLKLSSNEDVDFILGMKTTLQGLLVSCESGAEEQVAVTTNVVDNVDPSENSKEIADAPVQVVDQAIVGTVSTSAVETVVDKTSDRSSEASEPLDDGWCAIGESEVSSPREEATIQSLDYSNKVANAVKSQEALRLPKLSEQSTEGNIDDDGIPTVASAPPSKKDGDEDNVWVKVGGGIAVLGAVVGGAFLAMNQNNENNKPDVQESQKNSSVEIERLDEEEDVKDDNWEPASNT